MEFIQASYNTDILMFELQHNVQGWAKVLFPGLVNLVPAGTYHFCPNLPATLSQPGNGNLSLYRAGRE